MTHKLITYPAQHTDLVDGTQLPLELAGQAANKAAARYVLEDYQGRKATATLRRQERAIELFTQYLADVGGLVVGDLFGDLDAWRGVTWGLVQGFVKWLLEAGYAMGTINVRLSTIRTYTKLATAAGVIDGAEYARIATVRGYGHAEGLRKDARREATRQTGSKKATANLLTRDQARTLKSDHAGDGQGARDRLMFCILLDHGLRVGELTGLTVDAIDLDAGIMTFYRSKVGRVQTHKLSDDTLDAARAYFAKFAPKDGGLLRTSTKGGRLASGTMTTRAITKRVRYFGQRLGIENLGAHDLRHTWATWAARAGTPLDRLQDAGGWASLAMPMRYIEAAAIANEGVESF
jgi:integrase